MAAAVFTVGSGGTHSSIQSALEAAIAAPGADEVRISTGTWLERVGVAQSVADHTTVSGGWTAGFTVRVTDPTLTVIDAQGAGSAFRVSASAGYVEVSNLRVTNGRADSSAGIGIAASGSGRVHVHDCVADANEASSPLADSGVGGGISIAAADTSFAELRSCVAQGNRASGRVLAWGAGIFAAASGTGSVVIAHVRSLENSISGAGSGAGSGLYAQATDQSSIQLSDSIVRSNSIESQESFGGAVHLVTAPFLAGSVEARRFEVVENTTSSDGVRAQVRTAANGTGRVTFGDSLVAASSAAAGVVASAAPEATLELVNLSMADNTGFDLEMDGGVVSNSLAEVLGPGHLAAQEVQNLFQVDPLYRDRDAGDYRLASVSPAIDAGTPAPVGGLGPYDLDGYSRSVGTVDLGAYETQDPDMIFAHGFE